ncbi:MAG: tetratricopeptide repeat protein, partial [Anaerolineae bacterium]
AALDWYTRALDMLARLKPQEAAQYQSLRLPVHQSLGSVLAQLNRRDEALQHTQRAVELAVEQGQQLEEGVSRRAQGEIYRALGNPDAAAAALRHSLQILSDLDNPYQVAKTRLALARLALESGAPADADPLLTQAIETFKTLEAHFDLAEAQKLTRQL